MAKGNLFFNEYSTSVESKPNALLELRAFLMVAADGSDVLASEKIALPSMPSSFLHFQSKWPL